MILPRMTIFPVDEQGRHPDPNGGFDVVLGAVADEKDLGCGYIQCTNRSLEDLNVGFGVTGFARKDHCIEKRANSEASQNRIHPRVEIRDDAEFYVKLSELSQHVQGFRK